MSDLERELRISRAYHRMLRAVDYAERVRWWSAMALDIGMRSDSQVGRMEKRYDIASK